MTNDNIPAELPQPAQPPPASWKPVALWATAGVFLLATTAFVTLWFLERGDHRATVDQLGTARTELDGTKSRLAVVEKLHADTESSIKKSEEDRQKFEAEAATHKPCAKAGREFLAFRDAQSVQAAVGLIFVRCR
ncbi:hypothetical protein LWC34_22575 [Kibdelosporangium philippinense]|uniref:Uncharacterized protein n=1 Tax=Kibdelosporangium philippinense TaxID=211113 RepID=A0ABS8ZE99_9PSEU|nr:hypothetical protein [Kibdelosporangium philippinense]MCE7005589.1 hypothetical protein [Kibdelosporangium philippinense]